jgi:hypothetical protein
MKADTEFPGVGSVDKKPRLKLRVKRIVGQGDNIAQRDAWLRRLRDVR